MRMGSTLCSSSNVLYALRIICSLAMQTYDVVKGHIDAVREESEMPSRELRTLLAIGALRLLPKLKL